MIYIVGMLSNGLALSGVMISPIGESSNNIITSEVDGEIQVITSELDYGSYPILELQKGIPVVWSINASESNLNGCNNEIIINQFGIKAKLEVGLNESVFTPTETGDIGYSCWMGMIRSRIRVL